MNRKQLEIYIAVAESGSFSRGAELSFLTQSTVSIHISSLEQELGMKLLDRTPRGVFPTEGGKILLEHARRLVGGFRDTERAMARFRGIEEAHLAIGASTIPGIYLVPATIPVLSARFPGIQLTLLQGDSLEVLHKLQREEVELGVVGSRFATEGINFTPLGRDEIRLLVGPLHPWWDSSQVQRDDLYGQYFVMREPGSGTRQSVEEKLVESGLPLQELKVRASLGSNEAVKRAVAGGMGIAFLSLVSVQDEMKRGELRAVEVAGIRITRQFFLAGRTGRELSPAAAAFAGILQESCRTMGL